MIGPAVGSVGVAAQQTSQVHRYPAPIRGIDQRLALGEGDQLNCVYTYNLCPFEFGMRVRKGYREWQVGAEVEQSVSTGVHTLIPFDSKNNDRTGDRLFAVTNEGIWDVTVEEAAPILMYTFLEQDVAAGYGVYTHYVTAAASDLLFYADSLNGLFQYDPALDTWVQATQFTAPEGVTAPLVENISFVVSHKQRLWFIEENTATAWYLAINSIAGEVSPFYFGSKFRHGGNLAGLFSWSVDGGAGLDDMLVAVSRSGDVLPYQGSDPGTADSWDLVGTYYIGAIPQGPHFGTEHGGELFLLSTYGLSGMNQLLQGVDSEAIQSNVEGSSVSLRISGIIRDAIQRTGTEYGWAIRLVPSEGGVLVSSPTVDYAAPIQYYYNVAANAWGLWRDVPMTAFTNWRGEVMVGDKDARVLRMDNTVDNELISPPEGFINGADIEFSILTSFNPLQSAGVYKRVKLIRPDFLANLRPAFTSVARYDYVLAEPLIESDQLLHLSNIGSWDVAKWDKEVWGSDDPVRFNSIGGAWGPGRYVAIATRGRTRVLTRLIGWDVIYDVGGPLI